MLHPDRMGYGAGQWALTPPELERYRHRISDEHARLAFLEAVSNTASIGCKLEPATLARVPRGYDAEQDWADLLKRKSVIVRTLSDVEILDALKGREGANYVSALLARLAPLNAWMQANLG